MTTHADSIHLFRRRSIPAIAALLSLVIAAVPRAQAPARDQPAGARLPIKRVVLYKSGVGYFEHLGRVRGDQAVTIEFTTGQLDDVLKSLTALDLDGGRVLGVSYNSEASLDRRLGSLRLPVGQGATRSELLSALRGARLDVRSATRSVVGRLLSVERVERRTDATTVTVDALSLVNDAGEIQTVALDPGVSVRILDSDLSQEVGRYLSLVASVRDQDVRRVTIATSGAGDRDLFVSYISEVPVWKPTYRLVLPAAASQRKPLLQGWAIVDNTVGEDWVGVELSLVAGAPQSFVQAISRPYYVRRPVVSLPDRVQLAPQTHQSALGTAGAGAVAGTVTDANGEPLPGVAVRVTRGGVAVLTATSDVSGRFRVPSLAPGSYELAFELNGYRRDTRTGVDVAGGMETVVGATLQGGAGSERSSTIAGLSQNSMNISIDGVTVPLPPPAAAAPPAQPGRAGGAGGGGGRGGASAGVGERAEAARLAQQSDAAASQLGDLFEYRLKEPITIRKNQSALVPILSGDVTAEKVSLWSAGSGTNRPLRAVWLTNTTGLTLDGGSFSVVDGDAFAGEGLISSLKAGERRLLSYAIDLGVQIESKAEPVPVKVTKVSVNRGVVIQQTEERQRRSYVARNEDAEPRIVIVEHAVRPGWTTTGTITPSESTATVHRFRLEVAPKTSATFSVDDVLTGQRQVSVSSITDDQVTELVRGQLIDARLEAGLRRILDQKVEVARLDREIGARQSEIDSIGRDQERVRENMKSLKGSGEEKQLLQRYVKQLDEQENRLAVLRKESDVLRESRAAAQAELNRLIVELGM